MPAAIKNDVTLKDDLQRFYNYLQAERRYSSHTVAAYRRDIKHFIKNCELQESQLINWDEIKQVDIRRCVATLHRQGLSGKSLQRWLSSIRSLYKFLCRFDRASNNPALGILALKSAKRLPNFQHLAGVYDEARTHAPEKNNAISITVFVLLPCNIMQV